MNEDKSVPDQEPAATVNDPGVFQPAPDRKFPKKPLIAALVAIAALAVVSAGLIKTINNSNQKHEAAITNQSERAESTEPKAVEQVFISPLDGVKTHISESEYYTVTVNSVQYYGKISKINDEYLRVGPTAYKKPGNLITLTGSELHGPEPYTFFRIPKITGIKKLDAAAKDDATIIDLLKSYKSGASQSSDAYPSAEINKYLQAGQFQAYFFTDGTAFFAKTTSLDGAFLSNASRVYILKNATAMGPTGPSPNISLVLATPDQYSRRMSADLLYWQNMKSDSQITKAASEFEQHQ